LKVDKKSLHTNPASNTHRCIVGRHLRVRDDSPATSEPEAAGGAHSGVTVSAPGEGDGVRRVPIHLARGPGLPAIQGLEGCHFVGGRLGPQRAEPGRARIARARVAALGELAGSHSSRVPVRLSVRCAAARTALSPRSRSGTLLPARLLGVSQSRMLYWMPRPVNEWFLHGRNMNNARASEKCVVSRVRPSLSMAVCRRAMMFNVCVCVYVAGVEFVCFPHIRRSSPVSSPSRGAGSRRHTHGRPRRGYPWPAAGRARARASYRRVRAGARRGPHRRRGARRARAGAAGGHGAPVIDGSLVVAPGPIGRALTTTSYLEHVSGASRICSGFNGHRILPSRLRRYGGRNRRYRRYRPMPTRLQS